MNQTNHTPHRRTARSTAFVSASILAAQVLCTAHPAQAGEKPFCTIDRLAGLLRRIAGPEKPVQVVRGEKTFEVTLPTCVQYDDQLEVEAGVKVHLDTASDHADMVQDERWTLNAPKARQPASGSASAVVAPLWNGEIRPPETISIYSASRTAGACPPATSPPPPLAAIDRLRETSQRIGADLRAIVVIWQPSPQPRLVRAKLQRADGAIVTQATTCHGSSLPLLLRSTDLHPNDQLTLTLTDTNGGSLRYDITVIDPASLPQPPAPLDEDWLVATWRLAGAPAQIALDSVSRVAKASNASFGAQQILSAIATDAPL